MATADLPSPEAVSANTRCTNQRLTPTRPPTEWVGLRLCLLDDIKIAQLLQEAEDHLRQRTCRQRYEDAVFRLPDSRRNIRPGEENLDNAA